MTGNGAAKAERVLLTGAAGDVGTDAELIGREVAPRVKGEMARPAR